MSVPDQVNDLNPGCCQMTFTFPRAGLMLFSRVARVSMFALTLMCKRQQRRRCSAAGRYMGAECHSMHFCFGNRRGRLKAVVTFIPCIYFGNPPVSNHTAVVTDCGHVKRALKHTQATLCMNTHPP